MNDYIDDCPDCGRALRLIPGQAMVRCRNCQGWFYRDQVEPKTVVLKPELGMNEARRLLTEGFRHRLVSGTFLQNFIFRQASLYFIPFFEVRGVRAGWQMHPGKGVHEYGYQTFDFLEKANELSGIKIGLIDYSALQESILNASPVEYDPAEMRKKGVVLPPMPFDSRKKAQLLPSADVVEIHFRIVYCPVWEIAVIHRGIQFKSYISAIDGRILKLHALKNHQPKVILAIGGLFGLSTLLSRGFKMAFLMTKTPLVGFSLIFLVLLLPLLLFLTVLLFPYLWRMFAFREELVIRGKWTESLPINYSDNRWMRFSRIFSDRFTRLFENQNRD